MATDATADRKDRAGARHLRSCEAALRRTEVTTRIARSGAPALCLLAVTVHGAAKRQVSSDAFAVFAAVSDSATRIQLCEGKACVPALVLSTCRTASTDGLIHLSPQQEEILTVRVVPSVHKFRSALRGFSGHLRRVRSPVRHIA